MATLEQQAPARPRYVSARFVSIVAALAADAALFWTLLVEPRFHAQPVDAERYWVLFVIAFGAYAVLQQWTLANQTGRGDDFTAALDKFVSASPMVVVAVIEAYWLGAEGLATLSWRHQTIAALCSAFALTDFFATDITNQRLKARQFTVGELGS